MADQTFNPEFEQGEPENIGPTVYTDGVTDIMAKKAGGRPFIGQFDLAQCEIDIQSAKPIHEIDQMVQALLIALLAISPGSLSKMVRDVSDTTAFFRFYDLYDISEAGVTHENWVKLAKSEILVNGHMTSGSVFLRLFSRALIQFVRGQSRRHPLVEAFVESAEKKSDTLLTPAHKRFILKEFGTIIFGSRSDIVPPSAPAPWSTQFLLFSAGHVYEACQTILPKTDLLKWSTYVHTHILDLTKELLTDFPYTPWGEKLFFYFHLMAADISDDAQKVLMSYWEHHTQLHTHHHEMLNSAWRSLLERQIQQPKRLSATQILGKHLRDLENSNDTLAKWIGDDNYRGEGVRDIRQFIRDMSQLRVDRKSSAINFGKLFSSEN